jgi:anti-sigma factor RsiW
VSDPLQPFDREDLHAFVDGRLPAERAGLVKAWLARNPAAREQAASWQRQNDLIGRLYGGPGPHLLPVRLRPELMRRGRRRMLQRMAAVAAVALLVGSGTGWLVRGLSWDRSDEQLIVALQAARAYWKSAEDVSFEVDANGEAHLPGWFAERLGHSVPVPDLTEVGLHLLGGSAVTVSRGTKAALLVYENAELVRFTLYIMWGNRPEPAEFRFFRMEDVNGFYWPHQEFRCVLTANVDPDELLDIARFAYDQMELDEMASSLIIND